ncbi:conserved protein of unknown function (Putative phage protein Gp37/Gp68) [Magnetospirillum sp. XM-1]|uniref:DUF5131 family protein n=1 Tax=Magnetospirillum sp. XM-1 TaxID=1663591 RepID=UPI00073DE7BC|nr:DUF5131 family protein [Magnetospirillum sp. XM-1]CUW37790.1 conserved protein of unknown function (Putative phage protein Gp37/Gp68) [Magnetospirillum sp. XM-1]
MATQIEWSDEVLNPFAGCSRVSTVCKNCYAERWAYRLTTMGKPGQHYTGVVQNKNGAISWTGEVKFHPEVLQSIKGNNKIYFVNSMSDMWHEKVDLDWISQCHIAFSKHPENLFLCLTKRAERLGTEGHKVIWPSNVWMGVSVGDKHSLAYLEELRKCPAKTKFVSIEPLIEDLGDFELSEIDWVILGGESGKGARIMEEPWVRRIKDLCDNQNVPLFFKQWGDAQKISSSEGGKGVKRIRPHTIDRKYWLEYPAAHPAVCEKRRLLKKRYGVLLHRQACRKFEPTNVREISLATIDGAIGPMTDGDNSREKKYGEVFTPPELVNEVLDQLPASDWLDPSLTYLDPAMGTGNFLVEVVRRKINGGSTSLQALETTYGIELLPDNTLVARARVLKAAGLWNSAQARELVSKNLRQGDALSSDLENDDYWDSVQEIQFPSGFVIATHNAPYIQDMEALIGITGDPAKQLAAFRANTKRPELKLITSLTNLIQLLKRLEDETSAWASRHNVKELVHDWDRLGPSVQKRTDPIKGILNYVHETTAIATTNVELLKDLLRFSRQGDEADVQEFFVWIERIYWNGLDAQYEFEFDEGRFQEVASRIGYNYKPRSYLSGRFKKTTARDVKEVKDLDKTLPWGTRWTRKDDGTFVSEFPFFAYWTEDPWLERAHKQYAGGLFSSWGTSIRERDHGIGANRQDFINAIHRFARTGDPKADNQAATHFWKCWDWGASRRGADMMGLLVTEAYFAHTILSQSLKIDMLNWYKNLYD